MTTTTQDAVEWLELTRRAALASHRLVGWVFFDPVGAANYSALGVPGGLGYYIATRGATLGAAGDQAVTAAFGSIHPNMVAMAMGLCREHTTFEAAAAARDAAVVEGLRTYAPEICADLAALAAPLWAAADQLSSAGRVLFASLREWPRPTDDGLLSAWLAVNCLREWRGTPTGPSWPLKRSTWWRPECSTEPGATIPTIGFHAAEAPMTRRSAWRWPGSKLEGWPPMVP